MLCRPNNHPDRTYVLKGITQAGIGARIIQGEMLYWMIPEQFRQHFVLYHKHWKDSDNFYIILEYYPKGTVTSFIFRNIKSGKMISLTV